MNPIILHSTYAVSSTAAIVGKAIVGEAIVGQIYKPSEITIGTAEDETIIVRSVNNGAK